MSNQLRTGLAGMFLFLASVWLGAFAIAGLPEGSWMTVPVWITMFTFVLVGVGMLVWGLELEPAQPQKKN